MKVYNPFVNGTQKWDIDWTEGTVRVIQDGSFTVIGIECKDGRFIVLNVINLEVPPNDNR